jgi:hypothetical protein
MTKSERNQRGDGMQKHRKTEEQEEDLGSCDQEVEALKMG